MYTATTEFTNKVNQAFRPAFDIVIEYGQIDPDARDSASVNDKSSELAFSNASQAIGEAQNIENIKITTLEAKETLLDGSFNFAPTTAITDHEVGFRPDSLSDADGNFSSYPYIKITTASNINSAGLTITFSQLLGQYAVDFDVEVGSTTYNITGNNKIVWCSTFTIENVNSVKIIIKKWCKGFTRAKITQIDFGFYLTFTVDDMTKFSMTDYFNPISTQLSDGKINLDFLNIDKKYNPFNLGAQQKFIVDRQPITTKIGYKDNMYEVGYHELSGKPTITESTVQLTGYSLISKLNKNISATLYQSKTYKYIAEDILTRCGVTKYLVDSSLDATIITTIINGNAKDVISNLLIATCKQIWQVGDTLYIGSKSTIDSDFDITSDIEEQPTIEVDNMVDSITCKYCTYTLGTDLVELTSYTSAGAETVTISTDYALEMALAGETSYATLNSSTINSATVTFTAANKAIKVCGKKITKTELQSTKTNDNNGTTLELSENPFIQSETQAQTVLNWINSYYNNVNSIETKWRQNPIIQTGDIVGVATDFNTQNIYIEENTIEIKNGGLSGTTKGRLV